MMGGGKYSSLFWKKMVASYFLLLLCSANSAPPDSNQISMAKSVGRRRSGHCFGRGRSGIIGCEGGLKVPNRKRTPQDEERGGYSRSPRNSRAYCNKSRSRHSRRLCNQA